MAKGRRRRRNNYTVAILVRLAFQVTLVVTIMAVLFSSLIVTFATDLAAIATARVRGRKRGWELTPRYGRWVRSRTGVIRMLGPPPIRVQALTELLALSPAEFEHACGSLLRDLGYTHVKRVGGSGDLAVDIFARDPESRLVAVQCKRFRHPNRVGSPDVQRFIGMARPHHGADRAIIIATSGFTPAATALAHRHNIELVDANELSKLVAEQNRRRAISPAPS
jgi:restriction system protein